MLSKPELSKEKVIDSPKKEFISNCLNNLFHYSITPLKKIYSYPANKQGVERKDKPGGLWVSVEDDWEKWCRAKKFGVEYLKYKNKITLSKNANILFLLWEASVISFSIKYRENNDYCCSDINWKEVAKNYQGIIIAPYIWSLRRDERTHWYYGWDCASGCIWDKKAVSKIELCP